MNEQNIGGNNQKYLSDTGQREMRIADLNKRHLKDNRVIAEKDKIITAARKRSTKLLEALNKIEQECISKLIVKSKRDYSIQNVRNIAHNAIVECERKK